MNLVGMQMRDSARKMKVTVLRREGGSWHKFEVKKLTEKLPTSACEHPHFPEYVLLWGHHTKERTLEALGGGLEYTVTQTVGVIDNNDLPFHPSFI